MGATDKLIARVESQAETLAELRRLEEKHRGRIYDLEGQLARLTSTCDAMRQDITTLREENENLKIELNCSKIERDKLALEIETLRQQLDAARVYDGNTVAQWHQKACEYSAELRAIWTQMMQVDIAFPEEKSLVQSVQILRESHDAARAEIETLRQQLADAQREAVNLQKLHDHLRPRLDAAQGQLTRERLDAEERGQELERLRAFVKCVLREWGRLETSGGQPVITHQWPGFFARINDAIARVVTSTPDIVIAHAPANPAPVAEPLDGEGGA